MVSSPYLSDTFDIPSSAEDRRAIRAAYTGVPLADASSTYRVDSRRWRQLATAPPGPCVTLARTLAISALSHRIEQGTQVAGVPVQNSIQSWPMELILRLFETIDDDESFNEPSSPKWRASFYLDMYTVSGNLGAAALEFLYRRFEACFDHQDLQNFARVVLKTPGLADKIQHLSFRQSQMATGRVDACPSIEEGALTNFLSKYHPCISLFKSNTLTNSSVGYALFLTAVARDLKTLDMMLSSRALPDDSASFLEEDDIGVLSWAVPLWLVFLLSPHRRWALQVAGCGAFYHRLKDVTVQTENGIYDGLELNIGLFSYLFRLPALARLSCGRMDVLDLGWPWQIRSPQVVPRLSSLQSLTITNSRINTGLLKDVLAECAALRHIYITPSNYWRQSFIVAIEGFKLQAALLRHKDSLQTLSIQASPNKNGSYCGGYLDCLHEFEKLESLSIDEILLHPDGILATHHMSMLALPPSITELSIHTALEVDDLLSILHHVAEIPALTHATSMLVSSWLYDTQSHRALHDVAKHFIDSCREPDEDPEWGCGVRAASETGYEVFVVWWDTRSLPSDQRRAFPRTLARRLHDRGFHGVLRDWRLRRFLEEWA